MKNKMPYDNDIDEIAEKFIDLRQEVNGAISCAYDSGYEHAIKNIENMFMQSLNAEDFLAKLKEQLKEVRNG